MNDRPATPEKNSPRFTSLEAVGILRRWKDEPMDRCTSCVRLSRQIEVLEWMNRALMDFAAEKVMLSPPPSITLKTNG